MIMAIQTLAVDLSHCAGSDRFASVLGGQRLPASCRSGFLKTSTLLYFSLLFSTFLYFMRVRS